MTRMTTLTLALGVLLCSACGPNPETSSNAPAGTPTPAVRAAATPRPAPQIVTATAEEASLTAGGRGEAVVRLDIADGWHVNANPPSDKFYIGTEVSAEPQGGVTPGRPAYPAGLTKKFEFSEKPLSVYEGRTLVRLPLRAEASAAKGRRTLRARIRFQPCNDRECLQPSTLETDIPVNVS